MAVEYCDYCDQYIDLDYCDEHFPDQYWEESGRDHGKCQIQLEDEAQFGVEAQIKQTKIDRRTGKEDRRWKDKDRGK